MNLLIDVSAISDTCCNHGIEEMFAKAIDDDGGGWRPLDNPFIRALVELFTTRGLLQIKGVADELNAFIAGEHHQPSARPVAPPGAMQRWTAGELRLTRLYLESLPPAEYLLDDWEMLIDYLAQRYMPPESIRSYAEWLATKSVILGKVQANVGNVAAKAAFALMNAAPSTEAGAERIGLSRLDKRIIRYARARCTEYLTAISESLRHRIKRVIIDHSQAQFLGNADTAALQTKLFDEFSILNRDWRRVAVTESVENSNQGFIAAQRPGARVRRLENYRGACTFCREIDGIELEVVEPGRRDKNPWTMVWPGKTNVGRSAAPMKRAGGKLIERDSSERYVPAAGAQHPHCRGQWLPIAPIARAGDDQFTLWMDNVLRHSETGA
jgi:hypothetical protein